ncbi:MULTISPECIES: amino acid ABC transporter permease [unclassified Methanoregula]|uniref:amino acid ABC transporter permease n=1 Tax=unclassified Methanoregula TaxID=2649730 RepID=UPI0009D48A08|nr:MULTISPECIES: amino acid ABC transporter permease [unclassified Methanoregula]OPX64280.1 MAG: glutamine ABC transporter permease protein [Methanoregula sp. PtaB.Bin085]OPY33595.1 MAG: glutamine ABC transporter permease protein [Methanoregula sp. PtaU1.Bin006]
MDPVTFLTQFLMPALWQGLIVTLELVLLTAPFGLVLGIGIALGRQYGGPALSTACAGYVVFFKGCPLLLLLFMLYFGLPTVGITLPAFTASVLGFILCNAAYNSEYVRGAIKSIKDGQMTAAQALGMTKVQAIETIILPQALRRAIPGLSNEFIYLIKYSSLAYMITVVELSGAAKLVATKYFMFNEAFLAVGVVYLVLVTLTTYGVHLLEKRVAVPGLTGKSRA